MYRSIAVDQQVYDIIEKAQVQSGALTFSDAVRLILGLPPISKRRTQAHAIADIKAALTDHPDSTAAEVAQAIDLGYPRTTTLLVDMEKTDHVERRPAPSRRHARITYLWRLRTPSPAPDADTAGLREMVTEFLAAGRR